MHFSRIKGHEVASRLLSGELAAGRFVAFYLLIGPEGVGKYLIARAFGQALLCEGSREPACPCRSCRLYNSGNHPDALLLGESEAGELKLEDALAARDFLRIKPYLGGQRFLLVRDADRLNAVAQNALLKTLEEPPEGTVIFFTSPRPEAFLETVRSRARIIRTGTLNTQDCGEVLAGLGVPEKEAHFIADIAGGSPGVALSLRPVAGSVREAADALIKALESGQPPYRVALPLVARLAEIEKPSARRLLLAAITTALCGIYRKRLASGGSEPLGSVVSCLTEAYRAAIQNVRPELVAYVLALRLCRALRGEVSELSGVFI